MGVLNALSLSNSFSEGETPGPRVPPGFAPLAVQTSRVRDFARFLSRFFEPFVVAVSPTSAKLEPFGASHAEGSSFLCVFSKPLAQFWQRVRFLHVSRTVWAEAFSVDPPPGRPTPGVFFQTLRASGVENFGAFFRTLRVFGVENSNPFTITTSNPSVLPSCQKCSGVPATKKCIF